VHSDGSIWLPGETLYRVDPDHLKNYAQSFDVLIRRVTANGKHAVFEGAHAVSGGILNSVATIFKSMQSTDVIPELSYNQNALSFEFSASTFEKPGTLRFQFQLDGFDKNWSEWDSATVKEYTNIPEGNYQFRVRAKNLYGTLGTETSYAFKILPPWYRTFGAFFAWVLLSVAAISGILHLYTLRLRREKNHLEELVAERTQQLRDASLTDPLTGLRNRRFVSEILHNDVQAFVAYKNYLLESELNREGMTGKEVFGLFLLDMDFFKQVNDTYGHDAGDQLLKQFASILMTSVRPDDVVVRLGGEEFLVVLKKTKPDYIHVFAEKILALVAATDFDLGQGTIIRKTCSIGYTVFPCYAAKPDLISFEQGIMIADMAMYHAKHHGRNQAVFVKEGARMPETDALLRKAVSSLAFATSEAYLEIVTNTEAVKNQLD
jgi:diguanylate cyclase (GGDEF)-like protein